MNANPWADYDAPVHKLLSDNREKYFAQSYATRGGIVARFPTDSRIKSKKFTLLTLKRRA